MGINTNVTNKTKIIRIALYITYSVFSLFPRHKNTYILLESGSIAIANTGSFWWEFFNRVT